MSEEYEFRGFYISDNMMGGLKRYIEHGISPGSFASAVICNDLRSAVESADDQNMRNIPAFVAYLVNKAPMGCWGSKETMMEWMEIKRHERERETQSVT